MTEHALKTVARIQTVDRCNSILSSIAQVGEVKLTEIARLTYLNKTTAFNLLASLVTVGFVQQDHRTKKYQLGLRCLELGRMVQRRLDIITIARPFLIKLSKETRETVSLALPRVLDCLIVESLEAAHGVKATSYVGGRNNYHSTACGKAIIAHFDKSRRHAIYKNISLVKCTDNTITEIDLLEIQIEQVRTNGFALDFEENEIGANCVAFPIYDAFEEVAASISVSGLSDRFTPEAIKLFLPNVLDAAQNVSIKLGHQFYPKDSPRGGGYLGLRSQPTLVP